MVWDWQKQPQGRSSWCCNLLVSWVHTATRADSIPCSRSVGIGGDRLGDVYTVLPVHIPRSAVRRGPAWKQITKDGDVFHHRRRSRGRPQSGNMVRIEYYLWQGRELSHARHERSRACLEYAERPWAVYNHISYFGYF